MTLDLHTAKLTHAPDLDPTLEESYRATLKGLQEAPQVRYGSLFKARHRLVEEIRDAAGLYHFYQVHESRRIPLFVGAACFEAPGSPPNRRWGLHARISQHFHPSQKNSIAGRISRAVDLPMKEVIHELLCVEMIFLQWLPLYHRQGDDAYLRLADEQTMTDYERMNDDIHWKADYARALLRPLYGS